MNILFTLNESKLKKAVILLLVSFWIFYGIEEYQISELKSINILTVTIFLFIFNLRGRQILLTENEIIERIVHPFLPTKILLQLKLRDIAKCEVERHRPGWGLLMLSSLYSTETYLQLVVYKEEELEEEIELHLMGTIKQNEKFVERFKNCIYLALPLLDM